MESVLKKTVASLETALRYNPDNIELMTSLAEGYIRMGRLDQATVGLCEKVLSKYPDNLLLQQAQTIAYVIEQLDELDASLAKGQALPSNEVLETSIQMLDEFLVEVNDSATVWFARTRLAVLSGQFELALKGIERLKALKFEEIGELRRVVDWVARKQTIEAVDWLSLYKVYCAIDEQRQGIKALERIFDKSVSKAEIGPMLLENYLSQYRPDHPEEVPEAIRPRFFQLLLDYGESKVTEEWLRKASLYGWQVTAHSKAYARSLIEDEQLDTAFEILQRMTMDDEVKELLNEIAGLYEKSDEIDSAVSILQYINNHGFSEAVSTEYQEIEINRNMELSLAELQMKNGRQSEALVKYIAALCLYDQPETSISNKIDEILANGVECPPESLISLAAYFRSQKGYSKAVAYLNRLLERSPHNTRALQELETMYDEILTDNPDAPELRLQRGQINLRLGRMDEAITDFKIASAAPDLADQANRSLARTYHDAGHFREALNRYQSMKLAEEDLDPVWRLYNDFVQCEDARSATTCLRLINRVNPDYRSVAQLLEQADAQGTSTGVRTGAGTSESEVKMRELIGDLAVGRYKYISKVGSGGMGVVHKIFDVRHQRVCAMKILRDGLASSSKALDRFFREARIAAQIRHANIVDIFDYNISSQDGQNYIVMEYVDGQSLREFIDLHFDDTISTSLDYIAEMLYYNVQLFDALQATHEQGIIHRDIKPDNIMINSGGNVKITDFGIVHVEEATFTPTGAMLGTPRYMSPEQVTGQKVDGRSDIYSVGILLYEVLTGSPPFMTGDISYQQVNKTPVEPRLINSIIPQSVNNFIMKCLEKRPEARYAAAAEGTVALTEILASLGGCKKFEGQSRAAAASGVQTEAATPRAVPAHAGKGKGGMDPDLDVGPMNDAHAHELHNLEMDDLDLDLPG